MNARRIAFEALLARGLGRHAIQGELDISRSEYYRLLKATRGEPGGAVKGNPCSATC